MRQNIYEIVLSNRVKQRRLIKTSLGFVLSILLLIFATHISAATLTIDPSRNVQVEISKTQTFSASGGEGQYKWTLSRQRYSRISPDTGPRITFTAGSIEETVTLTVNDDKGNTAEVEIKVVKQGGGGCPPGQSGTPPNCELTNPAPGQLVSETDFGNLLIKIVKILLAFAGGIAVVFLMVGGFQYVMSRGNEEAMEKAKKGLTAAVTGIVIIIMAFAIVTMINTLLTKTPEEQGGAPPTEPLPEPEVAIGVSGLEDSYQNGDEVDIDFTATPQNDNYQWTKEGNLPEELEFSSHKNTALIHGILQEEGPAMYLISVTAKLGSEEASEAVTIEIRAPGGSNP